MEIKKITITNIGPAPKPDVEPPPLKKETLPEKGKPSFRIKFKISKKLLKGISILLGVIIAVGGAVCLLIGRPTLAIYQQALVLRQQANSLKSAVGQKDFDLVKREINKTEAALGKLKQSYQKLSWLSALPRIKDYFQDGSRLISIGEEGIAISRSVVEGMEPYKDFIGWGAKKDADNEKTTKDRIEFLTESVTGLKPKLDILTQKIDNIDRILAEIDTNRYPEKFRGIAIRSQLISGKTLFSEVALFFREGKPLLEKIDYLLGKDEPRKYLILFQNDGEIRPTGGFWTAYGVLKVEKGKISPLASEDMYDLDARFDSTIPAPEPIKKYLKNIFYWYLRDMNLSPDFTVSLQQFLPYYQKVGLEKEIDGVIAIDTQVLVDLLKVLGQVGVPGWGNFNAEPDQRCFGCPQVVYQLEMLADKPTSTIKQNRKGFLAPIMHSLLANAMGSPKEKIPSLFQAFFDNLQRKHILFYFEDPQLQKAIENLKFAGRILPFEGDYFHFNSSNFGGAKANLFITQEIRHDYDVAADGQIKKAVTVKLKNNAPASDCNLERGNLCLNNQYRNWFRFYLPIGSELKKITGSEIDPKSYDELGKTVFEGFFGNSFPLYPKGISKITIEYILPIKKQDSLRLFIQKQPGEKAALHEFYVNGKKQKELTIDSDTVVDLDLR